MKKRVTIIGIILLLMAGFFLFSKMIHKNGNNIEVGVEANEVNTVDIGGMVFNVDIADTEKKRNRGLSRQNKLDDDKGMLFVFEKSGVYPFWMKDMLFSIDIIWIDENMKVVYIKENATPESFPKIFTPDSQARYVLEVNAGIVKDKKFKIGDNVILNI